MNRLCNLLWMSLLLACSCSAQVYIKGKAYMTGNGFAGIGGSQANSFATVFSVGTPGQNPLSEGGKWWNGKTDGLDWSDMCATNWNATNYAFGLQNGAVSFTDGVGVLKGTWGATQMAQATVVRINNDSGDYEEAELFLRANISAHSITGYEIDFSTRSDHLYCTIVRWNGAVGDFTYLTDYAAANAAIYVTHGDVIKGTITNNHIWLFKNGLMITNITDNTWATGSPGIGHSVGSGAVNLNTNWGLGNFYATDFGTNSYTAPTLAQNLYTNVGNNSVQTVVQTFTNNITTGSALVVFGMTPNAASGIQTITSSPTNVWVVGPTVTNSGAALMSSWWSFNWPAGPVTVTFKATQANVFTGFDALEYKMLSGYDVGNFGQGTGGASPPATLSSGSFSTTMDGDLLLGCGVPASGTLTAGSGYTARSGSGFIQISEDQIQGSHGSTTATFSDDTGNDPYVILGLSFHP